MQLTPDLHNLVGAGALLLAIVALTVLRRRLGMFWSALLLIASVVVFLLFGVEPHVPHSLVRLYGLVTAIAVLIYATSSEQGRSELWRPIRAVMTDASKRPVLIVLLVALPAVAAWQSYNASLPASEPPPMIRSVHPSPPSTVDVTALGAQEPHKMDMITADNPLRAVQKSNPAKFRELVAKGRVVYYQNCYYCHGDTLSADGHFAGAVRPPPATFQDPGVLPLLQESFLFWRIAKGGPGLPDEGTPWDSVMPVWEKFLTEDEIWQVLTFLYDFTGYEPRALGEAQAASHGAH